MLKSIIVKAANKAGEFVSKKVDYIKEQVQIAKNVQVVLKDAESFAVDEVQIVNWVLDEAAKCQCRVHGFELRIVTNAQLTAERLPIFRSRAKEGLMRKVGIFGKINKVESFVSTVADLGTTSFAQSMAGETLCREMDGEDAVYIYPEQLRMLWWQLAAKRCENIESIVRQIVRHEFRHAEQILAIRKVGGEELVRKMFDLEMNTSYDDRIMEKDAWAEQHLDHYRPIEEFIKEALEAIQ